MQLTNQQYILIGTVAVIVLYRFDMLPKMVSTIFDQYLPSMIRDIIKPPKKVVVDVPIKKETPLPEGLKCDALDNTQCSLYPSACQVLNGKCGPVEVKKP